jgi:hypothetical protein
MPHCLALRQFIFPGVSIMFRLFFAAALVALIPTQAVAADACHRTAQKAVDARFGDALGKRVYGDPNTRALPIPATANDATMLVVSSNVMYLHKGVRVGVIDGYKGVGQFGAREIAHAVYDETFHDCAHPHHARHMMH